MFDFSPGSLFLSFVIGFVGLGLFMYGKKQQRLPHMIAGILYMAYPYFTETVLSTLIVGVLIGVGLWWARRMGW